MIDATVRVVIVDDELLGRRNLRSLLAGRPGYEITAECSTGKDAIEAISLHHPDLLFLDIQMPEKSGFDVLEAIEIQNRPAIIFVTAYDQHAIHAFEVQAIDYLLKPFDDERFERALVRAQSYMQFRRESAMNQKFLALLNDYKNNFPESPDSKYLKRLPIKSQGRIAFVPVDEIDWIEASSQYVLIHVDRQTHLIRESMNQLESQLSPERFFRIHRSSIVNLKKIAELRTGKLGVNSVVLQDGTALKVSRVRRALLQSVL